MNYNQEVLQRIIADRRSPEEASAIIEAYERKMREKECEEIAMQICNLRKHIDELTKQMVNLEHQCHHVKADVMGRCCYCGVMA